MRDSFNTGLISGFTDQAIGGGYMGGKRLCGISVQRESDLYTDALYTVLKKIKYFNGPKYMLGGMTGMAFKFISHKRMLAPSRYIYNLDTDSWKAVDRLGIYNEIYSGFKINPTFPLYQKKTIERVKESLDKDIPAIFWEPSGILFGVIDGYDDDDEVFFYQDLHHREDQILLYDNVGRVGATFWMFQVLGERIDKDIRDIYLDSIECCVDEWETGDNVAPFAKYEYGSGRKAYDYAIAALEEDCFNETGALNILDYAIIAKEQIYLYFQEVKNEFEGIEEAAGRYKNVSDIFQGMREIVPCIIRRDTKIDRTLMPKLINYLKEAKEEEEKAAGTLKYFLRETLYNRHVDFYDVKKYV